MTTIDEIKLAVESATDEEKSEIASALGLEQPAGDAPRLIIWSIVLGFLTIAFFFACWLTYERSVDDKSLAPFSEFAALALGAVAGLLAPSPIKKEK